MELVGGHIVSSTHLFSIARAAYERSRKRASSDREPCDGEPLVSIVFAAAAAEAFSNELGELADLSSGESEPPVVASLAALLREAETSRSSAAIKIQLAKIALSGVAYVKGTSLYQDFDLLVGLRNDLVHMKLEKVKPEPPDNIRMRHPSSVQGLRARNVTAVFDPPDALASWVAVVSTPATARWACNTATKIVRDLISLVPDSALKQSLGRHYRFGFNELM